MTLLIALIVVFVWPFAAEALRRKPNEEGQFATLIQGRTHFRWDGPEDGPVAVCVHGLTTPMEAYASVAEALVKKGYRVLRYDLYGRGLSSAPAGVQDKGFHLQQLTDLLADQRVDQIPLLLGYSMGGAIVADFAALNPSRVGRLVLITSAGFDLIRDPVTQFAIRWPLLGDWLHHGIGMNRFDQSLRALGDQQTEVPGINAVQRAQLKNRGFRPAVLSSLRGMISQDREDTHRKIAEAGLPVLAFWGGEDTVIPLVSKDRLADWNPAAISHVFADADHGLPYTHGRKLVSILPAA